MDPIHPIAPVSTPGIGPVTPAPRVGATPDGRHREQPGTRGERRRPRRPTTEAARSDEAEAGSAVDGSPGRDSSNDGAGAPDIRPRIDIRA